MNPESFDKETTTHAQFVVRDNSGEPITVLIRILKSVNQIVGRV